MTNDRPRWRLDRGATVVGEEEGGGVTFSVWCPDHPTVGLQLLGATGGERPMLSGPDGVFRLHVDARHAGPGTDYAYVLPGVGPRPDPVSRFQPGGVHGPSRVVAPDGFPWTDAGWTGLGVEDAIFYELHVGTFTGEGTFDGVRSKLDHLRALGVTAIELMPVVAFPGARNWGYDGVAPYAPHVAYGGPDGLRRLVDVCHASGLGVVLDVVYNHLGPEGCYLGAFGPYFSARHRTPWGEALNFDGAESDEVRRFFVDNALYWLTEYHVDGLRLDAIHGVFDGGAEHVLAELSAAFHAQAAALGRRAFLVAESDLNDVKVIRPPAEGGYGFDAQWSDDLHHALHAVLTGAGRGYFEDFGTMDHLAKAIRAGFVYDGQRSRHRRRRHGNSSAAEPGQRFVLFLQNHDQVANAYQGRRLSSLVSAERQKTAAAILFCTPGQPLLFMGEEMAETAPFHYFTSHGDEALAGAVREGRHAEYLALLPEGAGAGAWPDPQDEATLRASRLRWDELDAPARQEMLAFYRALIALRKRAPALRADTKRYVEVVVSAAADPPALTLVRRCGGGGARSGAGERVDGRGEAGARDRDGAASGAVVLLANLGAAATSLALPEDQAGWRLLLGTRPGFPAGGRAGEALALPPGAAVIYGTRSRSLS